MGGNSPQNEYKARRTARKIPLDSDNFERVFLCTDGHRDGAAFLYLLQTHLRRVSSSGTSRRPATIEIQLIRPKDPGLSCRARLDVGESRGNKN